MIPGPNIPGEHNYFRLEHVVTEQESTVSGRLSVGELSRLGPALIVQEPAFFALYTYGLLDGAPRPLCSLRWTHEHDQVLYALLRFFVCGEERD